MLAIHDPSIAPLSPLLVVCGVENVLGEMEILGRVLGENLTAPLTDAMPHLWRKSVWRFHTNEFVD